MDLIHGFFLALIFPFPNFDSIHGLDLNPWNGMGDASNTPKINIVYLGLKKVAVSDGPSENPSDPLPAKVKVNPWGLKLGDLGVKIFIGEKIIFFGK